MSWHFAVLLTSLTLHESSILDPGSAFPDELAFCCFAYLPLSVPDAQILDPGALSNPCEPKGSWVGDPEDPNTVGYVDPVRDPDPIGGTGPGWRPGTGRGPGPGWD